MTKKRTMKRTPGDLIFDVFVAIVSIILLIVTLYPFWNILIRSFNDPVDSMRGGIFLFPRKIVLDSYRAVMKDKLFLSSFKISFLRTIVGVPLGLSITAMTAFVLSREKLLWRRKISLAFLFTLYFSGGIVPLYMIIQSVGLTDNFWVYIIPNIMDVWNMLLIKNYIDSLPKELEESAHIDGANDFIVFGWIVLPVIIPILATVGLFIAVMHWNSWFDSHIYIHSASLKTLQAYLIRVLQNNDTKDMMSSAAGGGKRVTVNSETLRMATTIVATLPIILVYPFVQKYFVKGMLVGAVKA